MKVTIKDVAAAAGVSFSLVSAVLGNRSQKPRVSDATRQRIEEAARRLGYRRNALASQMQSGCSNVITLVSGNFAQEFSARIIHGALGEADSHGFYLKLASFPAESGDDVRSGIDRLAEQRPAAVISANDDRAFVEYLAETTRALGIPLIRVDAYNEFAGVPRILSDDRQGIRLLLAHLRELGCRSLGVMAVPYIYPYEKVRLRQFVEEAAEFGLVLGDAAIFRGPEEGLEAWLEKLLGDGMMPDALAGCGDTAAMLALGVLSSHGVALPRRVRLAGYSDFYFAGLTRPGLTSVHQDYEAMGAAAVRHAVTAIHKQNSPAVDIFIPTTLMVRESTAGKSEVKQWR